MGRAAAALAALAVAWALWGAVPARASATGPPAALPGGAPEALDPAPGLPGGPPAPTRVEDLVAQHLQALDTAQLEAVLAELNRTWAGYGPELRLMDMVRLHTGASPWDPAAIFRGLVAYLAREVLANGGLLVRLVVLAVLAALMQHLASAFAHEAAGRVAQAVVYLVLAALVLTGFGLAITVARGAIDSLSRFLLALSPVLAAALLGLGSPAGAALLHPLIPVLVGGMGTLAATVVFPLIFFAAALDVASGLHDQLKLTGLAALLRQGALVVLGLAFTTFLGVTTVKAAAGAVGDSVALRTAKYLTAALVPVVGKMFAEATELVWSSGLVLKSALGLLGVAAIFFIAVFPALKILSLVIIYRAAAAAVQPLAPGAIVQTLNTVATNLMLVFAAVATVSLMFFVAVTVLVGAAGAAMALR